MAMVLETITRDYEWFTRDYRGNGIKVILTFDKGLRITAREFYKGRTVDDIRLVSMEIGDETGWRDMRGEKFRIVRYIVEADTMYQGTIRVEIVTEQTKRSINIKGVEIEAKAPVESIIKTYALIKEVL